MTKLYDLILPAKFSINRIAAAGFTRIALRKEREEL